MFLILYMPGNPEPGQLECECEFSFIDMGSCPSILIGGLAERIQVEDSSKSFKGDLRPYDSSLEYLDDAFQILALKLRMAKARHKEALKEAIDDRPWYGTRSSKVTSFP
jgi:hypothetical protein